MKVCTICGKECEDNAKFCVGCGMPFTEEATGAQATPGAAENPVAEQAQPQQTPPQQAYNAQQPYGAQQQQQFGQQPYGAQQQFGQQPYAAYYDPTDHTAEFDAKDVSDNKVLAMAPYLLGWIGIVVALLAVDNSKYVAFHVKQAMKIQIISTLTTLCMVVLSFTIIVPFVCLIFSIVLFVVKIICFFQVCGNKAKEPPIVKSFTFLK